jgi:hypothetical protein
VPPGGAGNLTGPPRLAGPEDLGQVPHDTRRLEDQAVAQGVCHEAQDVAPHAQPAGDERTFANWNMNPFISSDSGSRKRVIGPATA